MRPNARDREYSQRFTAGKYTLGLQGLRHNEGVPSHREGQPEVPTANMRSSKRANVTQRSTAGPGARGISQSPFMFRGTQ